MYMLEELLSSPAPVVYDLHTVMVVYCPHKKLADCLTLLRFIVVKQQAVATTGPTSEMRQEDGGVSTIQKSSK